MLSHRKYSLRLWLQSICIQSCLQQYVWWLHCRRIQGPKRRIRQRQQRFFVSADEPQCNRQSARQMRCKERRCETCTLSIEFNFICTSQSCHFFDNITYAPTFGAGGNDIRFGTVLNGPTNGHQNCDGTAYELPAGGTNPVGGFLVRFVSVDGCQLRPINSFVIFHFISGPHALAGANSGYTITHFEVLQMRHVSCVQSNNLVASGVMHAFQCR